jgi:hypothetical protein
MSYGRSDLHDISVELMHETDKAWLVHDGTLVNGELNKVWIPKSQAELERVGPGKPLWTLTAPEWLLKSKGLL